MKKQLLAAAVVAIAVIGATGPRFAEAATPQERGRKMVSRLAAEPEATRMQLWKGFSRSERRAARAALRIDHSRSSGRTVETTPKSETTSLAASYIRCYELTKRDTFYNGFDMPLFWLQQKIEWCSDGTKLVNYQYQPNDITRTVWVGTGLWFFDGYDDKWQSGGAGYSVFRGFVQAEFDLCIVQGVGCIDNKHPYIDSKVYASGGSYTDMSNV